MRKLYKVLFLLILVNFGCVANTKSIRDYANLALPTATISGTTTVCQNATEPQITFTGSGGTAPYTFTYTVTGVPGNQTITTSSGDSVGIAAPTATAGSFVYTLVSVHDATIPITEQPSPGIATVTVTAPPVVDFTFTNDNSCSGTAILFTSSATGTSSYTYAWDFGDGTTSTQQNPSHSFTSLGCGTATFNVTLTVTGGGCAVTKTKTVTVIQKPDIDFEDVNATSVAKQFNNCSNASSNSVYQITVGNISTSTCISSYSVNWGDGNTQANISFPINHTYSAVGAYNMVITAVGTNGCSNSKTYVIKNVSNPLGGLNSPGSTQDLCAPTPDLQFSISNWGSNSLDTEYKIDYGDGSPILTLTQNQLNSSTYYNSSNPSNSDKYPIPHIYTKSSCPAPSFEVKLVVTNACGSTPFTLGNISILTKPQVNFDSPINACLNSSVKFTNTTIPGSDSGCVGSTKYSWDFGDPASGAANIIKTNFVTTIPDAFHTFSGSGTYTVTLTAQNGCGTSTKTQTICIEAPLTPQFTLNNTSGCSPMTVTTTNTTVTTNSCTTPTYVWNVAYAPAFCGTSIVSIPNQTTTNASYNFTEPGTYTIKLTVTNSCGSFSTSQTVTVKKQPTANINPIANVCQTGSSTSINPTATVPACTNTTYAWSFPGGTPATSTLAVPGTISYATTGNHTVSLSVTNECGTTIAMDKTFTINPSPTITGDLFSCVGFTSQLTGSPTAATTSPWTSSNPSVATVSSTGLVTGVSGGTATITYTNSNNCKTTEVFTVNAAPTLTPLVSSTVCLGGTPTVLSFTINGATGTPTYQWYSNVANNTTTGTAISGETNATYAPPSTTAGILYYYCIITLPSGGCANIKTNTASVTIIPNATITLHPTTTQNLCVGATIPSPLTFTYSGGTGTPSFQWYSNTTNSTTGGTLITGANSASYTPPVFTNANSYYYYATVSLSGNGCLPATTTVAEIIVYPDPTISAQPVVSQTLCQNATPINLDVTATGGNGAISYQWYSNATNSTTGGTPISGATTNSYTPPTTTVGTKYYYCIVSQNSTLGCKVTSATAEITVITAPTITQPSSSTICAGGTPSPLSITVTGATGTPQYQWFSNLANNTSTGTIIAGATTNSFNPPNSVVGTIYYYCIVTLPSGGCSSITSNTAAVVITAGATISTQPTATQSLCIGTTLASPLTFAYSGGTGTPSYQWYSNTTNTNTGGTIIPGATNTSFTPSVFTATGNYYYYAVVTLNGNGCGPISSSPAEVVIVADPIVSAQPLPSQTVCQTATASDLVVTVSGGIGTTYSYQWYSNTSNNTTSGVLITGAVNAVFNPPTTTVGTTYYYCVITQSAGSGCNVTSNTATVIVNLAPTFTSQPLSSTVCLGGTPTSLSVTYTNGVGTPTYQWYSNSNNINSGGTLISGATNASYNPPSTTAGTLYYYCIISLPATGGCSSISSNTATVIINALPTIDVQPTPTQSLCVGTTIATPLTVTYMGGAGTPTYQWYSNNTNSNTGGTIISGATNANFTPATFTATGNYYYYVVVTLDGNGCGSVSSNPAEIVIVADPIVAAHPLPSQTVCQSAAASDLVVTATGGIGATYSYQWYSNMSNNTTSGTIITGATNAAYTPSTTAVGTLYYYCVITQSAGSGCNATSNTATVIVNLAPTFSSQPLSSTICVGQTPTLLSVSYVNGVGTPQYQWYSNTTNTTSGSTLLSGATNSSYSSPNSINGTLYYYCIITLPTGGCSNLTSDFATVTINPIPVISNKTSIICSGKTFTVSPVNSGSEIVPAGTTYTWSNPTISPVGSITGASAQSTAQTEISQTLINTTTSPATVTYTITPLSGNCPGAAFTIVVTVNPAISSNVASNNSTCFGANNGTLQTNIMGGIPFGSGEPYQISWTGPNGFTSSTASISNLAPGNYNLSITDAGGCPINENYTITEPDDIFITTDIEKDITCFNAANGEIKITVTGGTLNYKIAWTKNGTAYASTEDLSDLSPGIYAVTVSDGNNCGPKTTSFTITEPPILAMNLVNKTNILCFGDATGTITVTVVGGTVPYTFAWSGPNGFTSANQNLTNLFAGTYNLTVTDNLGCTKNLPVQLTQTPEIKITATTTPIVCYGDNNASINLVVSGGVAPYSIAWSNLGSGTSQNNLSAGDYTITVTDALNCTKTVTVNIPEAPIFTVNPVVKNISCFGAKNGSINLNFVGGIAPIKLTWSDGSTAGTTRNNLGPGSYTVTIVDSKPCTIVKTFIILEPQLLVLSANLTNALDCNNANSGAINLLVSGGSAPFTYSWSNGATTEDLSDIPAGNYLVTVTDANGCSKQAQYSINRPPPIITGVVTKTDFNCDIKTVKQTFVAQVSGGVPPYQLVWSSGTVSGINNEIMNTTQNGTVILSATDAIGCKSSYSFNVNIPTLGSPSFTVESYAYSTYGAYSINDPIQFTNTASGDYISMVWDFGDGVTSTELNPVHTFINPKDYVVTQTVTYPFGCIYVQKITLVVGKGYVLVVPNAFTPNNDRLNDTFRPVTKALKNIHLDVYDTWGSLIYSETGDLLRGWDGKLKGINAENGNYFCKVSGETFYGTIVNENHPFVLIK